MKSKSPTQWGERALQDRLRQALVTDSPEMPPGLAKRALEIARTRGRQRSAAPRWAAASTVVAGLAVTILVLRVPHDKSNPTLRSNGSDESARIATGTSDESRRDSNPIPGSAPAARRATLPRASSASQPVTRRPADSRPLPDKNDSPRAGQLAFWQQRQAADLDAAARLLEQAGQVEPAYQLYSMSIEAAPTLEATLGAVRVLKKMDEATTAAGPDPAENSG